MAAPMFALQPIPNPTFSIDFGKCLPHKSYTAAQLQAALNKVYNPFGASWVVTLDAGAIISVDGQGIRVTNTVVNRGLTLALNFKNGVNFIGYAKFIHNPSADMASYLCLSNYSDTNRLRISFNDSANAIYLNQSVGGISTDLYNRSVVALTSLGTVELFFECYTLRPKFWVKSMQPRINTNGWQSVATTLAAPTNKAIYLVVKLNVINFYGYIQKLQIKYMDGVFT